MSRLKLKHDEPLSNFAHNRNLRRYIAVNGAKVDSPAPVENGDELRIIVCAPMVFGFDETFKLKYGTHEDTVTVGRCSLTLSQPR